MNHHTHTTHQHRGRTCQERKGSTNKEGRKEEMEGIVCKEREGEMNVEVGL